MDPAKTACEMLLTCWDRTTKFRKYIRSLGDNLANLKSKMVELDGVYKDVKRLVDEAEGEGWKPKNDAAQWLTKVEGLKGEVDRILEDGKMMKGKSCLCGLCFINCRARYKQSELAEAKKVNLETELTLGRNNFRAKKEDVAYEPADLILERSLRALEEKSGELRGVFETVNLQVKREEDRHMVRTPEVGRWLRKVEDLLEKEVVEILEQGKLEMEKARSHGGGEAGDDSQTQRNVQSWHGISRRVFEEMIVLKEKLKEGRGFGVFTYKPDDPLLVELPIDRPVGADSMFKEVWGWIEDETVKCIGLYGMGGVGKTHLLDRVHNQFLKVPHNYDLILRIVVSRPANLDTVQDSRPANLDRVQVAILEKLKLQEDDWKRLEKIERAALIRSHMKNNNFLLFLDDIWDPKNLLEDVGIPCDDNPRKYKIIFTTRQERVCNGMKSDRTKKLDCLPPDEALKLFRQILGEKTWSAHPRIPRIAERLVHECKYLPLAVKVVAGAMTGITEVERWTEAEEDLKSRLHEFEDMEKEVLRKLEFSYDRLPDETHKKCFLYLSIFPEDHEICIYDVINLWIGEGFLDVRDKGERIFRRLRDACLVEFVQGSGYYRDLQLKESVKMHDVTREMALWVYSDHGQRKNRVLVQEGSKSSRSQKFKEWKDVERISLWEVDADILDSLAKSSCSRISTLVISGCRSLVPDKSLLSMPGLGVLDLSDIIFFEFPDSFWNLTNLRYLKVTSRSGIVDVPVEIKNLNKLEVLILSQNFRLPVEVVPNLSSLRVFHWMHYWRLGGLDDAGRGDYEIELLEVLQMSKSVEEISLTLASQRNFEKLLGCHKLHGHLTELSLFIQEGSDPSGTSTPLSGGLENLRFLSLCGCSTRLIDISCHYGESITPPKLSRLSSMYGYQRLRQVYICFCDYLEDVTSLIYHAPVLETLYIESCDSLQELIVEDVEEDHVNELFPSLKYLYLEHFPVLERICRRALPFPSLENIEVSHCPRLREISLNGDSAKNSFRVIKGEEEWWEGLQWDDPATKQVFSTKFISWPNVIKHFVLEQTSWVEPVDIHGWLESLGLFS